MSSHIVILGAGGQLGQALQAHLPHATALTRQQLDITSANAVADYDWRGVEVIINAAAYTHVDQAETPDGRRAAWEANAGAVAELVRLSDKRGILLVHISSEYVFDGYNPKPLSEHEPLAPLSSYGASKAAGDVAVMAGRHYYLVRPTWVVGRGHNFVVTMAKLAQRGDDPAVVNDQIGRLTFADDLAAGITHLIANEAPFGTYNLTNSGQPSSWYDVAQATFELLGQDPARVRPVSTQTYFANKPEAATRPANSLLSLDKLRRTGFRPRDWREALKDWLANNYHP